MKIVFDGILMLKDNSFGDLAKRFTFPERAVPLAPKNTHITLIDWRVLQPYGGFLQDPSFQYPPIPKIEFVNKVWYRAKSDGTKESWALRVTPATQKALEKFVGDVMKDLGIKAREDRVFHISLANLTGNPRDSVR